MHDLNYTRFYFFTKELNTIDLTLLMIEQTNAKNALKTNLFEHIKYVNTSLIYFHRLLELSQTLLQACIYLSNLGK